MQIASTDAVTLKQSITDYIEKEMADNAGNECNIILTAIAMVLKVVAVIVSSLSDMYISIFEPQENKDVLPLLILGHNSFNQYCSTSAYQLG